MNHFVEFWNLHEGEEKKEKVLEEVQKGISFKGANLWILACAILIASIGLNVNSTAVIIGAMLISPLMGPIVGAGFALATYDFELLKKSGRNLLIATAVSLSVSFIYFYISPFKDIQSELLARTSPNIYDVLIALFGGMVGVISITRINKGNPIPGVAIATALMPPLCTAGFGLATANWSFFFGAFYLYSINCFFIALSTFGIVKLLKYTPKISGNPTFDKRLRYIISTLMVFITAPSLYLAYELFQDRKYIQNVEKFIESEFVTNGQTIIYKNIRQNTNPKTIELAFLAKQFTQEEIDALNKSLSSFGLQNSELIIKQNNADLQNKILSEIKKQKSTSSEKDLRIKQLAEELKSYKIADKKLTAEAKVIFPEIESFSIGRINQADEQSNSSTIIALYKAENFINEEKFAQWLQVKLAESKVIVICQ